MPVDQTFQVGDQTINVPFTRDVEGSSGYDFMSALNNAGYVSIPGQDSVDWFGESAGDSVPLGG